MTSISCYRYATWHGLYVIVIAQWTGTPCPQANTLGLGWFAVIIKTMATVQ